MEHAQGQEVPMVGAIAESLVGPLSPVAGQIAAEEEIIGKCSP